MLSRPLLAILLAVAARATMAAAQPTPAAPPASLEQRAARRFPQPVRVGDLIGRDVLQPTEEQHVLGRVAAVVRGGDGVVSIVVDLGGVLGFGTRPVAVPVEAMTLLGQYMEIVDFTPGQLRAFPTFAGAGTVPLRPDEAIHVGLSRPSH